jgi:hypothetical protein
MPPQHAYDVPSRIAGGFADELHRPRGSAERFVPDPFTDRPGARPSSQAITSPCCVNLACNGSPGSSESASLALLRLLLARYLGTGPREVEFRDGSAGKPELAGNRWTGSR